MTTMGEWNVRGKILRHLFQREKDSTYVYDRFFSLIMIRNNCELLNRFLPTDESGDKSDLGA